MIRIRMLFLLALVVVGLIPLLFYMVVLIIAGTDSRFTKIAIALDRAGNVGLGGRWWETISSRSGRKWPRTAAFVNWLFQDQRHCTDAIASDVAKVLEANEAVRTRA